MATLVKPTASLRKESIVSKLFGNGFGVLRGDMFKLALNGKVAVKADDGSYLTYDEVNDTLVDVFDFAFAAEDMFYHVPTPTVNVGDLIIVRGLPMYVKELTPEGVRVLNVAEGKVELIANSTTMLGNKFFQKVVSIFSMFGAPGAETAAANPLQNMLPLLLLSKKDSGGLGGGENGIMEMMLYSQIFGGGAGALGGITQNPMMLMMLMDKGGTGGPFGGSSEGGLGKLLEMQMMMGMMGGSAAANPFANIFGTAPATPRT